MATQLKAAILIVSETAAKDPATDSTGDVLAEVFGNVDSADWKIAAKEIVPDSIQDIQRSILQWTDGEDAMNLIVTSGGTGFAVKDVTPEAVTPILHKHAPGLVHGMFSASLAATPFALVARLVAGVRNKTLILTLPGSPKGAKENLQAVVKVLPHACIQAAGSDSRKLHAGGIAKLEQEAGIKSQNDSTNQPGGNHTQGSQHHHHHHGHGHGHSAPIPHTSADALRSSNPEDGPTGRHRKSQYPMISVEEALELIARHAPSPQTTTRSVDESLIGSILAEDVTAEEAVPAFRASIVDGYAVVVSTESPAAKGVFPVVSVSHAAPGEIAQLRPGQVARITTGAPLPDGATAVVMVEDTILRDVTSDNQEEKTVEILTDQTKPGENVREIGSDIALAEKVLRKGEEITAIGGELGLLASIGKAEVTVYQRPRIGVLSSGDEIVDHRRPDPLQPGQVRDCNRPDLIAALRSSGFEASDLGIVPDESSELEATLRAAVQACDVLITTGGASMGELDLMKPTIERRLDGTIHFGRVSMAPGKPTTFATVKARERETDWSSKAIFALPGNPASAIVTLHVFVLPYLHHVSGVEPAGLPRVLVTLDEEVRPLPQRSLYHRAVVSAGRDGLLHARSTGGQRSSRVGSLKGANALLCLAPGTQSYRKGTKVEALLMGKIAESELGR